LIDYIIPKSFPPLYSALKALSISSEECDAIIQERSLEVPGGIAGVRIGNIKIPSSHKILVSLRASSSSLKG